MSSESIALNHLGQWGLVIASLSERGLLSSMLLMLFSSIMRTFIIYWCDLRINNFAVMIFAFEIFFKESYCMLSKWSETLYLTDDHI